MIGLVIGIEILLILICALAYYAADNVYNDLLEAICAIVWIICGIATFLFPFIFDAVHGYIDYKESNDKDKARIVSVTQEQDIFHAYYKIEVEYLTNTPPQSGIVTNYKIETDKYYCYLDDKEVVQKLKDNLYKEVWIISGYKGGYESKWFDFGTKLIKDVEEIEEGEER